MRHGHWEVVKELGKGGQGVVSLAIDSDKVDVEKLPIEVRQAVVRMNAITSAEHQRSQSLELLGLLEKYLGRNSPQNTAALKVLHSQLLTDAKATQRLANEVRVLSALDHPSLIEILDSKIEEG